MERDPARAAELIAGLTSATFDEITDYVRAQPSLVELSFPRSLMIYAHAALFFEQILSRQAGDGAFVSELAENVRARHLGYWHAHGSRHGFDVTDRDSIAKVYDAAQERVGPPVRTAIDKLVSGDQMQGQTEMIVSVMALVVDPPVREEDLITHVAPLLQPYLSRVEPLMTFLQEGN